MSVYSLLYLFESDEAAFGEMKMIEVINPILLMMMRHIDLCDVVDSVANWALRSHRWKMKSLSSSERLRTRIWNMIRKENLLMKMEDVILYLEVLKMCCERLYWEKVEVEVFQ